MKKNMTIVEWRKMYETGGAVREVYEDLYASLDCTDSAWITIASWEFLDNRLSDLLRQASDPDFDRFPLWGIPFAVKDNIDVAGMKTTAACPAFAYLPAQDAAVVEVLIKAGAIPIGKTNMDQFATGLVGTRSPYGAVKNCFRDSFMAGGSSSGSAVVVAQGIVPIALGTDTAGSGRIPAACGNIVGTKPTRGAVSACGLVPACRSMDCVSWFTLDVTDACIIQSLLESLDVNDPFSRARPELPDLTQVKCIGVPEQLHDACDDRAREMFRNCCMELSAAGFSVVPVDFTPLHELAGLLYDGPWIAERYAAVGEFIEAHFDMVQPTVCDIILQGKKWSAVEGFQSIYRQAELLRKVAEIFEMVQVIAMPTLPVVYSLAEIAERPVETNSQLGVYTNFVNLADLCALAIPAGFDRNGLPFGLTLAAPAWQEQRLFRLAGQWQQVQPWKKGVSEVYALPFQEMFGHESEIDCIHIAVVGAHMSGLELNHQLLELGGRFLYSSTTAPCYRLYHLPGNGVPKPGMIRSACGESIELEVWELNMTGFGKFSSVISSPLGIGTIELHDNTLVKGFLCESWILDKCTDISAYGGWRNYLSAQGDRSG